MNSLNSLDLACKTRQCVCVRVTREIGSAPLSDLIKQVQAGNEIILTEDKKPVARLVPAVECLESKSSPLQIPSITGHRVMIPNVSQGELADELFAGR